jgi:L-lactate dehydrogenase complex protein LldF
MTTEEIELNPALKQAGIAAIETNLGEYIVQLRSEKPSHIITPAIHSQRKRSARPSVSGCRFPILPSHAS